MDHESGKTTPFTDRELELIDDLNMLVCYDNVDATRTFLENCSPEFRQKLILQQSMFPREPPIIYAIRYATIEMLMLLVDEYKFKIGDDPIRLKLPWNGMLHSGIEKIISTEEKMYFLSPLQNAICIGDCLLEKIEFLIDRGAEVNSTTSNGVTCLMLAALGDPDIFQFLIDKGASIDAVSSSGQTAFHIAVTTDQYLNAWLLGKKGADPFCCDFNGDYPISIAYGNRDFITVERLLNEFYPRATAFQLQQIEKLRRLVLCSEQRQKITVTYALIPSTELEDFQRVLELFLQLTREVFGPTHPQFFDALKTTPWCYLKRRSYDLWLRQLVRNFQTLRSSDLDVNRRRAIFKDMIDDLKKRVFDLINQRIKLSSSLGFDAVDELLSTIIDEAVDVSRPYEAANLAYLIVLLIRLALVVDCENAKRQSFRCLVSRAVKLRSLNRIEYQFLIADMCAWDSMPYAEPTPHVVNLLLECGADVDERDSCGNNVVHLANYLCQSREDYVSTAKEIAQTFVANGIHLDARNHRGLETSSCLRKFGIKVESSINLKCLAARAIRRFSIPVAGIIPVCVADFVDMH